jgi:hypothetical protein
MANAQRGEADLVIGGKTYTLQYGWNAISNIATVTGLPMEEVGAKIARGNFHADVFLAVVWGMLRKHHAELDLEAVGDLMDDADPAEISEAVGLAMSRSTVGGGGEKKENPQKASL